MNDQQRLLFAEALNRLDNDEDLLVMLAEFVSADVGEVLAEIRTSVEQRDTVRIVASVHKLKGMLSTFQSGSLMVQLQEAERLAKLGDADEATQLLSVNEDRVQSLVEAIKQLTTG